MHFLCMLYLLFSVLEFSYYLYAFCTLIFFPLAWSVRLPLWRLSWPSVLEGAVAVLSIKVDWSYYICVKALFWCCIEEASFLYLHWWLSFGPVFPARSPTVFLYLVTTSALVADAYMWLLWVGGKRDCIVGTWKSHAFSQATWSLKKLWKLSA